MMLLSYIILQAAPAATEEINPFVVAAILILSLWGIIQAIVSRIRTRKRIIKDYLNVFESKNSEISNEKKEDVEEIKQEVRLPTDEQVRSIATIGQGSNWISRVGNSNLFPMAFEWVNESQYKDVLKFKSLRSDKMNYAPTVRLYCEGDSFFYDGDWTSNKITINCWSLGNVIIQYPGKCFVKVICPYINFDINKPNREAEQIDDNSYILEIDYNPDRIAAWEKAKEEERRTRIEKAKEAEEKRKIEEIKVKIKERHRNRELEKIAMQELMDKGMVFPESSKRPPIPKDVADAVWNRDGGKCVYCGSTENLQFDHIIPFSKGGATTIENLQLLCQKCNLEKSNKIG